MDPFHVIVALRCLTIPLIAFSSMGAQNGLQAMSCRLLENASSKRNSHCVLHSLSIGRTHWTRCVKTPPFASVWMRLDALTMTPDAPPSCPLSPALTPLTPCCVAPNGVPTSSSSDVFGHPPVHIGSANNTGQLDQLRVVGRVYPFA